MLLFNRNISTYVIQKGGLEFPSDFQLHAFTRRGFLLDVLNFITVREAAYMACGPNIHLSSIGRYRVDHTLIFGEVLRADLQEAERSSWKAFRNSLQSGSLKRRAAHGSTLLGGN